MLTRSTPCRFAAQGEGVVTVTDRRAPAAAAVFTLPRSIHRFSSLLPVQLDLQGSSASTCDPGSPHEQMRGGAVNVGGTIAIRATASGGESTYVVIMPAVVNGHVDP